MERFTVPNGTSWRQAIQMLREYQQAQQQAKSTK